MWFIIASHFEGLSDIVNGLFHAITPFSTPFVTNFHQRDGRFAAYLRIFHTASSSPDHDRESTNEGWKRTSRSQICTAYCERVARQANMLIHNSVKVTGIRSREAIFRLHRTVVYFGIKAPTTPTQLRSSLYRLWWGHNAFSFATGTNGPLPIACRYVLHLDIAVCKIERRDVNLWSIWQSVISHFANFNFLITNFFKDYI